MIRSKEISFFGLQSCLSTLHQYSKRPVKSFPSLIKCSINFSIDRYYEYSNSGNSEQYIIGLPSALSDLNRKNLLYFFLKKLAPKKYLIFSQKRFLILRKRNFLIFWERHIQNPSIRELFLYFKKGIFKTLP